ncbi:MAG: PIG-L family deacetylase [Candidatus Solibacter usitatus]|nr:PIG-L family deacetylase [Candidatus Solibacter usitatus]
MIPRGLTLLFALTALAGARLPEDRGAAGLWQQLKALQKDARVLYIVAHPDDEDAGTLTLLARGYGAQVTLLSLTRGESGANLVTGDFFDRLGALRTLEHRQAAKYYGVNVRYTRFTDFGYSKSVDETWRNWPRQEVLGDVVRLVRELKPHVIISRWQGTARDGHGHHHAAGLLAREAFAAAADPARFANAGMKPWQASKLYSGNWRKGEPDVLAVDAGVYDAVVGRSYAEIGREGYRFQKSQGMGAVLARPGPAVNYYRLLESRVKAAGPETSFFDGLESAIALPPSLDRWARSALDTFAAESPLTCVEALSGGLREVRRLRAGGKNPQLAAVEEKFVRALAHALAVELEVLVEPPAAQAGQGSPFRAQPTIRAAGPGDEVTVSLTLHVRSGAKVDVRAVQLLGAPSKVLAPGRIQFTASGQAPTAANWRRESPREPKYVYDQEDGFGAPLPKPPVTARVDLRFEGLDFSVEGVPQTSFIDALGLQHHEDLIFAPSVAVSFASPSGLLRPGARTHMTEVVLSNAAGGVAEGVLKLELPSGWKSLPAEAPFRLTREGEQDRVSFAVTAPADAPPGEYALRAVAESKGTQSWRAFDRIGYPGLGAVYLDPQAACVLRVADVQAAPGLTVGYVMGTGDEVPAALRQIGVAVEMVNPASLGETDLSRFHAVMLGIRAYAARPELAANNTRLLDYVNAGGVLIVQYNTQEFDHNFGPYPYSMTARAEEVSEEDAPVAVLDAANPVFHWPNEIRPEDWSGWFEQRGSKFFTTWDERYTPLIETHDTGQPPQKGVWLQARHGKGLWVYCALAWYRQLPFGVSGALRIFANMVSQGAPDAPWRAAK